MAGACTLTVTPFGTGQPSRSLLHVNIESHSAEPWMAEDNATVAGVKVNVIGSCMMSAEDWADIRTSLGTNSCRLASAVMSHPVGGSNLISLSSSTSSIGGPYLKLTANQVIGSGVAIVRFELSDTTTACDLPAISHVWTQRMTVDPVGKLTRQIHGTLRTARNATASDNTPAIRGSATWDATKPWADLFRRAILPDVPGPGWRRESQEFAYDSLGTGLVYQITDKQYAYDLPNGVRMGDMEFNYERTAENAGIGMCRVAVDLEGDQNLMNLPFAGVSGNRKLVQAAVALSKARINASFPNCIITRMSVTEKNILSGFSIRFELDAQVYPGLLSTGKTAVLAPLAFMIGQRFQVVRTETRTMDAYGAFTSINTTSECGAPATAPSSYYMVPHYINNILTGMSCDNATAALPYAQVVTLSGANTYGDITIAICANDGGWADMNAELDDGLHRTEASQEEDAGGGVQIVAHSYSTTRARYDSGIVRMSPMYTAGADLVLQTRKPLVLVSERVEVSRANTAPDKVIRPTPAGAIMLRDEWNVAFGKFDPQGNRLFTGVYERTFQMYDSGLGGAGYATSATAYAGNVRSWTAPNGVIRPTLSALGTTASQGTTDSVFSTDPIASNQYAVPSEPFVT